MTFGIGMGDDHIEHKMLSRGIENAQKRIESRNFDARKNLLEYDDVSNALGLFAKLQHTMTPGSDLYLVYTHNWTSLSESIFDFNLKTFSKISSFKINYTIRL